MSRRLSAGLVPIVALLAVALLLPTPGIGGGPQAGPPPSRAPHHLVQVTNGALLSAPRGVRSSALSGAEVGASPVVRPANPQGLSYAEQTLSLINDTLLPGNAATANAPSATYFAWDNRTGEILVQGVSDSSIVTIDASTDTTPGGFSAPRLSGYFGSGMAVDPLSGLVFVADQGSHVTVADPRTGTVLREVPVGTTPISVAIDNATHRAFVPNYGSANLTVIDTQTLAVVANLPCGSEPYSVAFVPRSGDVYVGNWGSSNLTVYNATSLANVGSISVVSRPQTPMYDPDNRDLYVVGENAGGTSVINVTTNTVVATIPIGTFALTAPALDTQNGRVFLLDTGTLSIVDGATNAIVSTAPIGNYGSSVAFDPLDGDVYVTDGTSPGTVSVISGATGLLVSSWNDSGTPDGAIFNALRGQVYIANQGVGNISVMSSSTQAVVGTIPVSYLAFLTGSGPSNGTVFVGGACPGGLAELNGSTETITTCINFPGRAVYPLFDPANHLLYVSDGGSYVRIVNVSTGSITGSIDLPNAYPWEMALDPVHQYLFVCEWNWGNTSVIDLQNGLMVHSLAGGAFAAAYDPEDRSVWATDFGTTGLVYRYNTTTFAALPTLTAGPFDDEVLHDPLSHTMYVADSSSGSISVFNATTGSLVGTLNVGGNDYSLAYDPTDGLILSTGAATNNISVIDARSNLVVLTLPTGAWPRSVAYSAAGGFAAISDQNSGAVTLVRFQGKAGSDSVAFSVHPTSCGITFNGVAQASGSVASYGSGTYTATAATCGGFSFRQWNASGGVSVASPTSITSQVSVTGNGTLVAYEVWSGGGKSPSRFSLTFTDVPATCPLEFNGTSRANASTATFLPGNYTALAPSCSGYFFSDWKWQIGILGAVDPRNPLTLDVTGNGTLEVIYVPRPAWKESIQFSVNHAACSPLQFNGSSVANGSTLQLWAGTYTAYAPACPGFYFGFWSYLPTGAVTRDNSTAWANITVFANGTISADYGSTPPILTVSLQASGTSVPTGLPLTFTPTVTGGVPPYACVWSLNGTNTTTLGCSALTLTWAHPGSYAYRVWTTDARGTVAGSLAVLVAVTLGSGGGAPPLVAFGNGTIVSSSACSGPGPVNVSYTGNARDGVAPYTFTWSFGDGSPSVTDRNASHDYTGAIPTATLSVVDRVGHHAWANVTVNVGPSTCPPKSPPNLSLLGLGTTATLALLAVIAAAAILAVVVVVRRRHGSAPSSPAEPPATPEPQGGTPPPPAP